MGNSIFARHCLETATTTYTSSYFQQNCLKYVFSPSISCEAAKWMTLSLLQRVSWEWRRGGGGKRRIVGEIKATPGERRLGTKRRASVRCSVKSSRFS